MTYPRICEPSKVKSLRLRCGSVQLQNPVMMHAFNYEHIHYNHRQNFTDISFLNHVVRHIHIYHTVSPWDIEDLFDFFY